MKKYSELLWLPVVSLQSNLCGTYGEGNVSVLQPLTPLITAYYPVKEKQQLKLLNTILMTAINVDITLAVLQGSLVC